MDISPGNDGFVEMELSGPESSVGYDIVRDLLGREDIEEYDRASLVWLAAAASQFRPNGVNTFSYAPREAVELFQKATAAYAERVRSVADLMLDAAQTYNVLPEELGIFMRTDIAKARRAITMARDMEYGLQLLDDPAPGYVPDDFTSED